MDIKKELKIVQEENHKLHRAYQELLKQTEQAAQKIQQNNGVILFLKKKLEE